MTLSPYDAVWYNAVPTEVLHNSLRRHRKALARRRGQAWEHSVRHSEKIIAAIEEQLSWRQS